MGSVIIESHFDTGSMRSGLRFYGTKVKFNKDVWIAGGRWYSQSGTGSVTYALRIYRVSDNVLVATQSNIIQDLSGTRWYSFHLPEPKKLVADTEYWIGIYFSAASGNNYIVFKDQNPGANALPHEHSQDGITVTILGGGNATTDTYPPAVYDGGTTSGPEPEYEYSFAFAVSDTPILFTYPNLDSTAGLFSNETWTMRFSVDKPVRLTGIQWYSTSNDQGNVYVRPRVYRESDGALIGLGNEFILNKTTPGWQPVIPLDIEQPMLQPGIIYHAGFYFSGITTNLADPSIMVIASHNRVLALPNGENLTVTFSGRGWSNTDATPTSNNTSHQLGYALILSLGGQTHQMML